MTEFRYNYNKRDILAPARQFITDRLLVLDIETTGLSRVFDTSFSLCLPQIPYLSHLGFLFFVKFYDFIRAILCYLWYH
ncbi:MAG: hypothetical protein LKI32_09445, partial [Lachnospiraceae bacterium]|nr:hypothetical protein [Lachnospiraceae bacterium]MCI1657760.1 hypothetical protein [Lachnospiraceae bacterium]MCI2196233.1 hypothetical protein [Lachnospiraceae bacterium]